MPITMFARAFAGVAALVALLAGCAAPRQYTSLDLALLPCEQGDAPIFFQALEFDEHGVPLYADQVKALHDRFRNGHPDNRAPVQDFVVFIHGWNKNVASAEGDYQNFLCRLHAQLRGKIRNTKREGGLLVLGVFWPSTITSQAKEPELLLPVSYFQIRNRADAIAKAGLAQTFDGIAADLAERRRTSGSPGEGLRFHLIGHSFGGRMLVEALHAMQGPRLVEFLTAADAVNVVLINPAISPASFAWIDTAIESALRAKQPARFTTTTGSYLFNLHSFNDSANRTLFRLASAFNDDPSECAAGACGVAAYATICIDEAGRIEPVAAPALRGTDVRINVWNVDTTKFVFDHSDIYKGRMSTLLVTLLYDAKARAAFPPAGAPLPPTELRCP